MTSELFSSLDELFEAMRDKSHSHHVETLDQHGQWRNDLPTFGWRWPVDENLGVWSWDAKRLIVGTCADDLQIIPRESAGIEEAEQVAGELGVEQLCFPQAGPTAETPAFVDHET